MKIVIIGAGIAGLSTYLFLNKHLNTGDSQLLDFEIKIYEAHDLFHHDGRSQRGDDDLMAKDDAKSDSPLTGYAIGITKNGIDALRRLDEDEGLYDQVKKQGCPITKWNMSNARGWTIAEVSMSPHGKKGGHKNGVADSTSVDGRSIMITRQLFWEILRDRALQQDMAVVRKKVKDILIGHGASPSIVEFTDGSKEEADLIIGSDGLRSTLRRAMFQQDKATARQEIKVPKGWISWLRSCLLGSQRSTKETVDYITPYYEGLVGVGGFIPSSILQSAKHEPGTMEIVFGPNGFFGHGYINSDPDDSSKPGSLSSWWSTFSSQSPTPYTINPNISNEAFDQKQALKDLTERHGWWKQPVVQAVLQHVQQHGITQIYPTYTTPELPTWQKSGKVVLIGDAAHALQPSSGQGASQGLEDAESLALLLKHYLIDDKNLTPDIAAAAAATTAATCNTADHQRQATAIALEKFVKLRKPRLHAIYERSRRIGKMKSDMGFVGEMIMYAFIRVMTLFRDTYNEDLLAYDLPAEVERIIQKD